MKKGWKRFWMVIIIILTIGVVFVLGAVAMGYRPWDDPIGKRVYDEIHEEIIEDEILDEGYGSSFTSRQDKIESNADKLKIEVGGCKVELQVKDVPAIEVDTDGLSEDMTDKLKIYEDSDTLTIQMNDRHFFDDVNEWNESDGVLVITIPKDMVFEEVEIAFGAGEINIEELQAENIELKLGAGQAKLNKIQAAEFESKIGMGQFDMKQADIKDLDIHCGAGQAVVKLLGNEKDYNYEVKCGMGEAGVGSYKTSGFAGECDIDNNADRSIEVECGMGQVLVSFAE